jgi:hypothetical protein
MAQTDYLGVARRVYPVPRNVEAMNTRTLTFIMWLAIVMMDTAGLTTMMLWLAAMANATDDQLVEVAWVAFILIGIPAALYGPPRGLHDNDAGPSRGPF